MSPTPRSLCLGPLVMATPHSHLLIQTTSQKNQDPQALFTGVPLQATTPTLVPLMMPPTPITTRSTPSPTRTQTTTTLHLSSTMLCCQDFSPALTTTTRLEIPHAVKAENSPSPHPLLWGIPPTPLFLE